MIIGCNLASIAKLPNMTIKTIIQSFHVTSGIRININQFILLSSNLESNVQKHGQLYKKLYSLILNKSSTILHR